MFKVLELEVTFNNSEICEYLFMFVSILREIFWRTIYLER